MSSLHPRNMSRVVGHMKQAIRTFTTQHTSQNAYRLPTLLGPATALIAGTATAAYLYNNNNVAILPAVEASAPVHKPAAMERTFIMIKPDGVKRGLIADIIKRFEQRGYKLVAMKMIHPDDVLLNIHYCDLRAKPFFTSLVKHISSGPVVAMAWEGKECGQAGTSDVRGDRSVEVETRFNSWRLFN